MISFKLIENAKLNTYKGGAHGVCTVQKDDVNSDLPEFINS